MTAGRIDNYEGGEHCRWCCGTEGQVMIGLGSNGTVEMAPCPLCERGYRVEFGLGRTKSGEEYQNPRGGHWGKDGFWRGRDWRSAEFGLQEVCRCDAPMGMPLWVEGWRLARTAGGSRVWLEQKAGFEEQGDRWEDVVEEYGLMPDEARHGYVAAAIASGRSESKEMTDWIARRMSGAVVSERPAPLVVLVEGENLGRCEICGKQDQPVVVLELSGGRTRVACRDCRG